MNQNAVLSRDHLTDRSPVFLPASPIREYAGVIPTDVPKEVVEKGSLFAEDIERGRIGDFEKTEEMKRAGLTEEFDRMVHVSTFLHLNGIIYVTYYANTDTCREDPEHQKARLAFCPDSDPRDLTILDVQSVGDIFAGNRVNMVYDTILAQADEDTLMILWTAKVGDKYYRLYRPFRIRDGKLGETGVNRFRAGDVENDYSTTGIISALTAKGIGIKTMYSDIGIMQKFTQRMENGIKTIYTGTYSGDFNCIVKTRDFITWEYVSQPDFPNLSKWENAVYLYGEKCFYFVRQHDETPYGFLTAYDLRTKKWETPVLIGDSQSRSDFILYRGGLYLFHAPIDREHIGVVKIDPDNLALSTPLLQAKMRTSCFYPFVQYFTEDGLAMSYTVNRQHIRLARFDFNKFLP